MHTYSKKYIEYITNYMKNRNKTNHHMQIKYYNL